MSNYDCGAFYNDNENEDGVAIKKKGKRIEQRTRSLIVVDCDALILVLRD